MNRIIPLEMVDEMTDVKPAFETMIHDSVPGFQIKPDVEEISVILAALTSCVQPYLPEFGFNSQVRSDRLREWIGNKSFAIKAEDEGPHHDIGFVGIAAHVNEEGPGMVMLRQAKLPSNEYTSDNNSYQGQYQRIKKMLWHRSHGTGPWYSGPLGNGVITVFSEGIDTPKIKIPGAIHDFISDQPKAGRKWQSYRYAPKPYRSQTF